LEEIRELLALPAPLPFPAEKRHVLDAIKECLVNNGGIVPRDDLLSSGTLVSLELGDVFANYRTIAKQFFYVTPVPDGLARVPGRNPFLDKRGVVLPAFAVAPRLRLRRESDVDIRL